LDLCGAADKGIIQEIEELTKARLIRNTLPNHFERNTMTKFKYTCFISYRNGAKIDDHLNTFAEEFAKTISGKVAGFLADSEVRDENQLNVFLDKHIFSNYRFELDTLSGGLCKSIVWVVLFSRNYFSGSLWCASELPGMAHLEPIRLKAVASDTNPDLGFVVPVLLAGKPEELPDFLRKRGNHLVDLRKFYLRPHFRESDEFADLLTGLLDKIGLVQRVVLDKNTDLCDGCQNFKLKNVDDPNDLAEIKKFVDTIKTPPQPLN